MLKEEQELRKATNNLILVLLINMQLKQGLENFDALMSMSDYEKQIFENPAKMSDYSNAKEGLLDSFEKFKSTYGSSVISAAYEAFKAALEVPEFCIEIGIKSDLTKAEAATLFNKIFKELLENAASFPEEADGYVIFVEMVRQAISPVKIQEQITEVCPYCDGVLSKISKSEFFGEQVDNTDGYVWACECGAYAHIDSGGNVIGTVADTSLHNGRRNVKRIVYELSRLAGVTVFEGCKWLSRITERRMLTLNDIEFLNSDDCSKVENEFDKFKTKLKSITIEYPKSHHELMSFLNEGGRFSVYNAYGYKSGRLFIPIKVGEEAVRVRFRKTVQDIMLPKELDYQFKGNHFVLCHPTGKNEKFQLYAKEQRQVLYKENKEYESN